jgi:hypothetical protein
MGAHGVAVDRSTNDVFSLCTGSNTVVGWAGGGSTMTTFAGSCPTPNADQPIIVRPGGSHDLYVTCGVDGTHGINAWLGGFASSSSGPTPIFTGPLLNPSGLFANSYGDVFVTALDDSMVLQIDSATGNALNITGCNAPLQVVFDPNNGDMYCAAFGANAVVHYALSIISTGAGDPVFSAFDGRRFQVHGVNGAVYSIIHHASLRLTARFKFLNQQTAHAEPVDSSVTPAAPDTEARRTMRYTHPGQYMADMFALLRLPSSAARARECTLAATLGGRTVSYEQDGQDDMAASTSRYLSVHAVAGSFKQGFQSVTIGGLSAAAAGEDTIQARVGDRIEMRCSNNRNTVADADAEAETSSDADGLASSARTTLLLLVSFEGSHTVRLLSEYFDALLVSSDRFVNVASLQIVALPQSQSQHGEAAAASPVEQRISGILGSTAQSLFAAAGGAGDAGDGISASGSAEAVTEHSERFDPERFRCATLTCDDLNEDLTATAAAEDAASAASAASGGSANDA